MKILTKLQIIFLLFLSVNQTGFCQTFERNWVSVGPYGEISDIQPMPDGSGWIIQDANYSLSKIDSEGNLLWEYKLPYTFTWFFSNVTFSILSEERIFLSFAGWDCDVPLDVVVAVLDGNGKEIGREIVTDELFHQVEIERLFPVSDSLVLAIGRDSVWSFNSHGKMLSREINSFSDNRSPVDMWKGTNGNNYIAYDEQIIILSELGEPIGEVTTPSGIIQGIPGILNKDYLYPLKT